MATDAKPVALITGGARGIGLGISQELANAGFRLAINGRRAEADVAEALEALEAAGGQPFYCQADIQDLDAHAALVDQIQNRTGRLDLLVNNAGVAPLKRVDLLEATPESFDRVMGINLRGPYFLTQRVANWMIQQQQALPDYRPAVINISSISAIFATPERGAYCLSKAAMAMATQVWATRLGEFGIGVYEVRPGIIHSNMTAGVVDKYDRLLADGLAIEPRWGEPEDVGRAVKALATGAISYATGAVIPIDGGMSVRRLS